jgi:hypothetical protein
MGPQFSIFDWSLDFGMRIIIPFLVKYEVLPRDNIALKASRRMRVGNVEQMVERVSC